MDTILMFFKTHISSMRRGDHGFVRTRERSSAYPSQFVPANLVIVTTIKMERVLGGTTPVFERCTIPVTLLRSTAITGPIVAVPSDVLLLLKNVAVTFALSF